MEASYPIFNGKFIDADRAILVPGAIPCLGDIALKYELRASENKVFFLKEVASHIQREARFFRVPLSDHINNRLPVFEREIQRLLIKNKLYKGAKIVLTLWGENGKPCYLLQAVEAASLLYELPEKGEIVAVLELPLKSVHPASVLPSFSKQLWKLGEIFCNDNGYGQCIIKNQFNTLVEVMQGNLFILKNDQLITPATKAGAVQTVLREKVIKVSEKIGLEVLLSNSVTDEDLREADEVFWTDDIQGVNWAMGWEDCRYFNRFARVLVNELNIEARK